MKYDQVCRDWLAFLDGKADTPLETVTKAEGISFRTHLVSAGLSTRTTNQTVKLLRSIYQEAVEQGIWAEIRLQEWEPYVPVTRKRRSANRLQPRKSSSSSKRRKVIGRVENKMTLPFLASAMRVSTFLEMAMVAVKPI